MPSKRLLLLPKNVECVAEPKAFTTGSFNSVISRKQKPENRLVCIKLTHLHGSMCTFSLRKMSYRPNEAQDEIIAKSKQFYNTRAFFFKKNNNKAEHQLIKYEKMPGIVCRKTKEDIFLLAHIILESKKSKGNKKESYTFSNFA